MFVVTYRRIFFAIGALAVALSIAAVGIFGLRFGIEFTGGELIEARYGERPSKSVIQAQLNELGIGGYSFREAGVDEVIVRMRPLSEEERGRVFEVLQATGASIERFNAVGPTIGKELRTKALVAIAIVVLMIILYVALAFRGVSKPVSSWVYGVIAIVALIHDIIIPVGVFALLGYLFGAEAGVLFVMALLAILGYSVNDTIVVFDRVRENLKHNEEQNRKEDFAVTVGKALEQTYVRSINTSLTTLLALFALFFVGGEATQDFALVLIAGIVAGTFSSICLAAPLLVSVEAKRRQ